MVENVSECKARFVKNRDKPELVGLLFVIVINKMLSRRQTLGQRLFTFIYQPGPNYYNCWN